MEQATWSSIFSLSAMVTYGVGEFGHTYSRFNANYVKSWEVPVAVTTKRALDVVQLERGWLSWREDQEL